MSISIVFAFLFSIVIAFIFIITLYSVICPLELILFIQLVVVWVLQFPSSLLQSSNLIKMLELKAT